MKEVVAAFNQEKALVGPFSVITNLRMELFEALVCSVQALLLLIMKFKPNLPESNWLVLLAADLEV